MGPDPYRHFVCPGCGHRSNVSPAEALRQLQAQGMLRREPAPESEVLWELYRRQCTTIGCEHCGHLGVELRCGQTDDGADWGDARSCERCGGTIPPERIEIFPNAKRCAACQDLPEVPQEDDYCPRCGGLLSVRRRGGGVTRYRQVCDGCGWASS